MSPESRKRTNTGVTKKLSPSRTPTADATPEAQPSARRARTHPYLDDLCTPERFDSALAGLSATHRGVVECIVRQNILSGRVAALLKRDNPADDGIWMRDYIERVGHTFSQERVKWQRVQQMQNLGRLYEPMRRVVVRQIGSLNAQYGSVGWNVDAIRHETIGALSLGLFHRYPFDVTLWRWVQSRVHIIAADMYGVSRKERNKRKPIVSLEKAERTLADRASLTAANWGRIDDNIVALNLAREKLTDDERLVLDHLLLDEPISVTAGQLGIKDKTVYLRRARVVRKLRTLMT